MDVKLIKEVYGQYPEKLIFNCFKLGELISEDFDETKIKDIKEWILEEINKITNNEDWKPTLNYWRCNYLCDVCDSCEYKEMIQGGERLIIEKEVILKAKENLGDDNFSNIMFSSNKIG